MKEIVNELNEATKILKQENNKYERKEEVKKFYMDIIKHYNKYFIKEYENPDIEYEDIDLHYILDKSLEVIYELEYKIDELNSDIYDLNQQISDLIEENKPDNYPGDLD